MRRPKGITIVRVEGLSGPRAEAIAGAKPAPQANAFIDDFTGQAIPLQVRPVAKPAMRVPKAKAKAASVPTFEDKLALSKQQIAQAKLLVDRLLEQSHTAAIVAKPFIRRV